MSHERAAMRVGTIVDLSHAIRDGLITYPGLPAPTIGTHLSRDASRARYAAGTEFDIGTISMVANTGTYLDTPFHRYADGIDLAGLPAERCTAVPGVVVRATAGRRGVEAADLEDVDIRGRAVLFHTAWDRHFGTPAYAVDAPFLTEAGARRLVERGAMLVGIDSVNIDDITTDTRPAHSLLLAAGIPIVEHLTGLERLPDSGFEFTALPPRVEGMGTFPVRAVARITG
jgi:arylformamidase